MKVLVTGATGFIGRELLKVLRDRGYEINALTRDPESSGIRLPVLCNVFKWDHSLLEPPLEAFEGVDAVVHLAGESVLGRWSGPKKEEISRSRILSTHHIVQAFEKLEKKPAVFIAGSATGFYGDRQAIELDESASAGSGFLSTVCQDWEREMFAAEKLGIRTVALRTGVVLGSGGGAMSRMLPSFRMCLGARLGDGRQWMSWIHHRDLAELIVHCIQNDSLKGPVNAVSPNPVTNRDFTKAMATALHRPAFLIAPKFLLKTLFGEMGTIVLDSQKVVAKKVEESGFEFIHPTLETALPPICHEATHTIEIEQWVSDPPEKVFAFFMEPEKYESLTPPFLSFKVHLQTTKEIQEGTRLIYSLKLHGIRFCWQSLITDFEKNKRFSDLQVFGPYSVWHHTHQFIEKDGGTLIRDCVVYRVPLCVPGDIVIHPFVRKDLDKIFTWRRKKMAELFNN